MKKSLSVFGIFILFLVVACGQGGERQAKTGTDKAAPPAESVQKQQAAEAEKLGAEGIALDKIIWIDGKDPAYQVGEHDSKDRFRYDGEGILRGSGTIQIRLNPEDNSGKIVAEFDGPDGKWRIVQEEFKKIATQVFLHGATGGDIDPELSPPVLPQIWTYVGTWGPAKAYHNGELAWTGPTHLMVTEQVRDPETGKVDYKGPKMAKEYPGSVHNPNAVQVHFVSHPPEEPTEGYLPPFTKFVHLMWETVEWK